LALMLLERLTRPPGERLPAFRRENVLSAEVGVLRS
jgi:hypothetical protein